MEAGLGMPTAIISASSPGRILETLPKAYTADILGAVFGHHDAIITRLGRILGKHNIAQWIVCNYGIVADIDHHDIAVIIHGHPIGDINVSALGKYMTPRRLPSPKYPLRRPGVGDIGRSVI